MNYPEEGYLSGRVAIRISRTRRLARSLIQSTRRKVGRGRSPDERVRDILREGSRAFFRRKG